MKVRGDIIVTTSKGDNFIVREVTEIKGYEHDLLFISLNGQQFDRVPRDRSIELTNTEVEDIGF